MRSSRRMFSSGALAVAMILAGGALAQGFPYENFERSTLGEITAEWSEGTRDSPDGKGVARSEVLIGRVQRIVVRVTYRGQHHPITPATAKLIRDYEMTLRVVQSLADRYEDEYLFSENGKDYWLPVQASVAAYFAKELKPGDAVDLYAIAAGGTLEDDGWKWVFPVEEFTSGKDTR